MDDYTIKTPEQVDITYTVAGLGTRFLALGIDTLIQAALLTALGLSMASLPSWEDAFSKWYVAVVILVVFLIYGGYFLIFELLLRGRTPGKAVLKIRVVRMDGRAADLPGILVRNLIRLIDFLPALYAVGVCCMFINPDSRRLGDLVAGTVVVVEKKKATLDALIAGQPDRTDTLLNDREYAVVRDFLARRGSLTPQARGKLAEEIAAPLFARLDTPPSQRTDPEKFLETLL